jgi:tRNA(Ile)-lysidine synthase
MTAAAPAIDFASLPADVPVLVGFSGGLDSTVLLDLLVREPALRGRLRAIHVHHGLHPGADAWAAHCAASCERLGIALAVRRVAIGREAGLGPEGAAREARHSAFADDLRDGEVLALAHHRDDQAETFLLRALRASGPDGLAAMRPWRPFGAGWLWRPLLAVPRATLLEHARRHGLAWIEDPSNAAIDADRNFLRHRVLPLLAERWPHAPAALARSAALCAGAAGLLEDDDRAWLQELRTGPDTLDRTRLRALPAARRSRLLRRWTGELGLPRLPARGVACIEAEVLDAAPDAAACFAWSGAVVRGWRNALQAGFEGPGLPGDWSARWDGRAALPLPTGDALRLEPATPFPGDVRVHARQGGERIRLPGRAHSHALKHVLQDLGVPPWERTRLPLLSDAAGTLLAAGDVVASAAFDAWLRHAGARLSWQRARR